MSSSLRVNVCPRGDSMNLPDYMCYGVLLMWAWLLNEVWSWSRWWWRWGRDHSSSSWMVNGGVLRWQKMPCSNVVSWN